jgi:hypothetical protein
MHPQLITNAVPCPEYCLTILPIGSILNTRICLQKSHIASLSVEELRQLGLHAPDVPVLADTVHTMKPRDRLQCLHAYILAFEYNYISGYHYNTHKRRPFNQIMNTARDIIRDGLPIKCIEATFLGMLLTCKYPEWQRFPVGFKTKILGHSHVYRYVHD